MIDREHIRFIENILSLTNTDFDIQRLYSILTAIKEQDNVAFLQNILSMDSENTDLNLLLNVYKTVKDYPTIEMDLLDSFSNNQIKSKSRVLDFIEKHNLAYSDSEIIIIGSWYGSILIPGLAHRVKKISCIDLDEHALKIAKNRLFPDYKNIEYIRGNVFDLDLKRYHSTDLFINTSCEHMPSMKEWSYWPKNTNFVFTSNNMWNIEGHVNCVEDMSDFKSQLPANATVLSEDTITDERGSRFLLAGRIETTN